MPAKPTKATDQLITLAEVLLGSRYHKGDVKRLLAAAHERNNPGDKEISSRTLETVISTARANLLAGAALDREQARDQARQFYDSVLRNPSAKVREKILAQAQLDKLLGLRAPITHLVDGTAKIGLDLTELTADELNLLERIAAKSKPGALPPSETAKSDVNPVADAAGDSGLGSNPGGTGPAVPEDVHP